MRSSVPNGLLFIVLVAVSNIALTTADEHCSNFDTSVDGWTNTGSRDWYWSGDSSETPYLDPSFVATSGYMWFQDRDSTPNTGTIVSDTSTPITIYPDDEVSISIYRYILNYDGTYRPVLNFVSNSDTYKQNILWSFDVEVWSTVSLLCGSMAEACCLTYPCTGYFSVDGSILARDEFLAIDNVQLNDGCASAPTSAPTAPTITPTPSGWCCTFDTSTLCDWSLTTSSTGWHWSGFLTPTVTVPTASGDYIFEQDDSAEVYSATLFNLPSNAQFSVKYYFDTLNVDPTFNNLQFYFRPSGSTVDTLLLTVTGSTTTWIPATLAISTALCGSAVCDGQFVVKSFNKPGNTQIAAIDQFNVVGYTC